MQEKQNNYLIPGAIIIAGLLIAFGIYSSKNPITPKLNDSNAKQGESSVEITGVSQDDHINGNPNADFVFIEYSDLECPFCKTFHNTMNSIINTYGKDGKVSWVYRHFPLDSLHPKARKEAEATECATEQLGNSGFWKFANEVFRITTSNNTLPAEKLPEIAKTIGLDVSKFNECLSSGKYASKVQAQYEDGMKAGARGTPYTIMLLKETLKTAKENELKSFMVATGLSDNLIISADKNSIILNGALPLELVNKIMTILI